MIFEEKIILNYTMFLCLLVTNYNLLVTHFECCFEIFFFHK